MEVSGQLLAPAALHPACPPYPPVPIGQEVWWAPEPVWTRWRREKNPVILNTWKRHFRDTEMT